MLATRAESVNAMIAKKVAVDRGLARDHAIAVVSDLDPVKGRSVGPDRDPEIGGDHGLGTGSAGAASHENVAVTANEMAQGTGRLKRKKRSHMTNMANIR